MSNFVGHCATGVAVSVAAGCAMFYLRNVIGEENYPTVVATACTGVLFGSFYPDTDIKSKSGWICNVFLLLISLFCVFYLRLYFIAALPLGMFLIPIFVKHRGLCHNIWFHLILVAFMFILGFIFSFMKYFAAGYFLGALSHLGIDNIKNKLYPFTSKFNEITS